MSAALTSDELIGSLQNEVRILLHLAGKIDRDKLDYRPSPGQRSTIELLRYLSVMGPELTKYVIAGAFDMPAWTSALERANAADFDQLMEDIKGHSSTYASLLSVLSDQDFRDQINMFGQGNQSRGTVIAHLILGGCAAYRMQLFLYLKACGRNELNTYNVWAGVDPPAATA